MSRQNYYLGRRQRQIADLAEEEIVASVGVVRREHPRMGGKKLHGLLQGELRAKGIEIGRDRFFRVLGNHGLLVKARKRRVKTTNSKHTLPLFGNRLKDMKLDGPDQAWVADLTYLRTEAGFVYASLLTDAYSRKIVGFHLDDRLESEGCLQALKMALSELPEGRKPVHHSDRGCQYCSHRYVDELRRHGMEVSMTEVLHCYENAQAERVNGILKQEYYMDTLFVTKDQARLALVDAVRLYNEGRPHLSLDSDFPSVVHRRGRILSKRDRTATGGSKVSAFGPSDRSLRETGGYLGAPGGMTSGHPDPEKN